MDPPHPAQLPHRKVALEASDLLPALIDGDQPRWCCRARIDTYSAILEVDENDEPIRWRGLIPVGDLAALEQQAQRERWHFIPYMATLLLPDVPYGFTMNDGIVLVDAQFETNFCRITTPQQRSKRKAVVK